MINSKLAIILLGVVVCILSGVFLANSVTYSPIGRCLDEKGELIGKNIQANINELFRLVRTREARTSDKTIWLSTAKRVLSTSASNSLNTWTDLDLSSHVTDKTKFVILNLYIRHTAVGIFLSVRKNGVNSAYFPNVCNQVNNQWNTNCVIVACDDSQIIEWHCGIANATQLLIDVVGYIEQE